MLQAAGLSYLTFQPCYMSCVKRTNTVSWLLGQAVMPQWLRRYYKGFSHRVILHYLISYIQPLVVSWQQQDILREENHQSFLWSLQTTKATIIIVSAVKYSSNHWQWYIILQIHMYHKLYFKQWLQFIANCLIFAILSVIPIDNDHCTLFNCYLLKSPHHWK